MKKFSSFIIIIFVLFLGITLSGCNEIIDMLDYDGPEYIGITITGSNIEGSEHIPISIKNSSNNSGQGVGHAYGRNRNINQGNPFNNEEDIDDTLSSDLEIISDDSIEYYAKINEDLFITVKLSNPQYFEILSFTLNGIRYQSYQFYQGSDSENLILKVNAGEVYGVIEYSLDSIKYVDGTLIKDVLIEGNRTVKTGIRTPEVVEANITNTNESIDTISFDVEITDTFDLLEQTNGYVKAFLYNGESIVAEKNLLTGNNEVVFDNLHQDTLYQYAIVAVYDDLRGEGCKAHILSKLALYTRMLLDFNNVIIEKDYITFDLIWFDTDKVKSLDNIQLFKDEIKVNEITPTELTGIHFNLFSGKSYIIKANFRYESENDEYLASNEIVFNTLPKEIPIINIIDIVQVEDDITFDLEIMDEDDILDGIIIVLFKGEEKIGEITDLETRAFIELIGGTDYKLILRYTFDLNDEEEVYSIEKEYPFIIVVEYASLTITGIMEGATILFGDHLSNSWNLSDVIGANTVTDGDENDHSGIPGEIKLINLDVFNKNNGTSVYAGTFGTVLKGMSSNESLFTNANHVIDFTYENNLVISYEIISGEHKPFESGQGTASYPYVISNEQHLKNIGRYYDIVSLAGIFFEISNDINLSVWNTPLCNTGNGFDGILRGGGNTLANLRFTASGNYHGLFARLNGATIENLIISGGTMNGGGFNYIGFLAGYINASTITNVTLTRFSNTLSGGGIVGGFAGQANNTVFNNCEINDVNIGSGGNQIGGYVGILSGSSSRILNSKIINVSIASVGFDIGGMVGRLNDAAQVNNNTLEGSSSTIGANNSNYVGGFVGRINSTNAVFNNNEIKGNVTLSGQYHSYAAWQNFGVGGMVGRNDGIVRGNKITSGIITIRASVGGGIVGVNYGVMGELNATETGSIAASDNVLSGQLIDFDLRPESRSVLGGHVGGNYGSNATIIGARNTKVGSNDWIISNSLVVFRDHDITFDNSLADNTIHGTKYNWQHSYFGGIAGYNASGATIRYSSNGSKLLHARKLGDNISQSMLLIGYTQNVHMFLGGIAGENAGNILNCQSNGGIIRSYNFLDADHGVGSEWGSGGDRRREYNRLGGIVGSQVGGAVNNCSVSNTTIYLRGIKYSNYRFGTLGIYSYNQSDLTVSGRTGVGQVDGGTRSSNSVGTGNLVYANYTKVGSRTDGDFNFTNDTSTNFN